MLHQFSRKQQRDRALFAHWDALDDGVFARIPRERLRAAQAGLLGQIILPGNPQYDTDRKLFNPVFDAHPIMIVMCRCEYDVKVALILAESIGLGFTVRSGGHCTAGFSAGSGVLIDVSGLDDVTVDPVGNIATVGPGCPFSKLDRVLEQYRLHVPGGECDDVCIGGYMQGGGYGFTSVTFGMNCDNVIDMRVMLADGGVVTASETENADLWWAMRGGTGGNFGIVTSVRYQLRPLGDVFGWALIWPLQSVSDFDDATGALMLLQSRYMGTALPAALNIQVSLCYQPGIAPGLSPNGPQFPYLMVRGLYVGSESDGRAAIQPLCDLPGGTLQWTRTDSFRRLNKALLNEPYGMPCIPDHMPMPREDKASRYVTRTLAESEWRSQLQYFVTAPNPLTYLYLEFYGGAIATVPASCNAFVHRTAAYNAVLDVFWLEETDRAASERFLLGWMDLMAPMWNGEIYQNYPRRDEPDYAGAYWGDALAGLYAVKCKYDPTHRFRFAQEVCAPMPPGGGPGPVIILPPWLQQPLDQPIAYTIGPDAGSRAAGAGLLDRFGPCQ